MRSKAKAESLETSRQASALKSLTWRVLGVIILATITFALTRKLTVTTEITLTHHGVFLLVFYVHERVWARISRPTGALRHITKAILYEIVLGFSIGGAIVYVYTRSMPNVTLISGTYTCTKLIVYPIFDRFWPDRAPQNQLQSKSSCHLLADDSIPD